MWLFHTDEHRHCGCAGSRSKGPSQRCLKCLQNNWVSLAPYKDGRCDSSLQQTCSRWGQTLWKSPQSRWGASAKHELRRTRVDDGSCGRRGSWIKESQSRGSFVRRLRPAATTKSEHAERGGRKVCGLESTHLLRVRLHGHGGRRPAVWKETHAVPQQSNDTTLNIRAAMKKGKDRKQRRTRVLFAVVHRV